mmetsp:Transcript_9981/g.27938  ORF Transcript_9981/g.27938 Transcript_9981/m.27938 type:complete len:214 (+) Transcript_9981:1486-2127(+)
MKGYEIVAIIAKIRNSGMSAVMSNSISCAGPYKVIKLPTTRMLRRGSVAAHTRAAKKAGPAKMSLRPHMAVMRRHGVRKTSALVGVKGGPAVAPSLRVACDAASLNTRPCLSASCRDSSRPRYSPFFARSSLCVPCSTRAPLLRTQMTSCCWTERTSWVTLRTVTFGVEERTSSVNIFWIPASVSESRTAVASSRRSTTGFRANVRANAIRCF